VSRGYQRKCPVCGAHYWQDYEEPDECPNGCDNEEEDGDDD